jgi:hypothetical protein
MIDSHKIISGTGPTVSKGAKAALEPRELMYNFAWEEAIVIAFGVGSQMHLW